MVDKILNAKSYLDIFTRNEYVSQYKQFITQYHPDIWKDERAVEVTMKLNQFYKEAKDHDTSDTWGTGSNVLSIKKSGSSIKAAFRYSFESEVGPVYVGDHIVIYEFSDKKYYSRYLDALDLIKYKDSKMKNYFSRFLPVIHDKVESTDGKYFVVLKKSDDVYPLSLVTDIFKDKVHSAWILTRLMNFCCLFYYNKFVHCGICIDNCFVSLKDHGLFLFGGWQFGRPNGVKMFGTTKLIYDNLQDSIKSKKVAVPQIDIESSKLMVKKLLGCNSYTQLVDKSSREMAIFLNNTNYDEDSTPMDELQAWENARKATFPKNEFIKIKDISPEEVFKN